MGLYISYFKVHFKSALQYKLSLIFGFLSQTCVFITYYFAIICLFDKFSNVNGFTKYEVLFTFSIIHFGASFCESMFYGLDQFDHLIIDGTFDKILLRPKNVILQLVGDKINFIKISRVIQILILFIIALIKINVDYDIIKVTVIILMLLGSITLFFSVLVLTATYCFYTVKGLEIRNVISCGCRDMAEYPIGIFKKSVVLVLTYIIPMGLVNYYPLLYVLGRSNNLLYAFSPIATIIYLIISIAIFYRGLKKYNSTGS